MKILISGTPGTGKTSTAKLLAKKINAKYIDLNKLAERNNWFIGWDNKREVKIMDTEKISTFLSETEENIVVDTHIPSAGPPNADYVFILRIHPRMLLERLRNKGYSEEKVLENVQAEILDVCLIEALENFRGEVVWEINASKRKTEDIVSTMLKIMNGEVKERERIDWLSLICEEGSLEKFFKP